MNSPSIVRLATPADAQELWRLTLAAHHENALRSLAPERINWWMQRMLFPEAIPPDDTGPRGVVGVIGKEGALEGMVLMLIGKFWYTNEFHGEELIVFCDQSHRRSNHTTAMVKWMLDQCRTAGVPLLTGIISNHRTEAKVRLYRRLLGNPVGAFFFVTPKGTAMSLAVAASS